MRTFKLILALVLFSLAGSVVLPVCVPEVLRPEFFVILVVFVAVRAQRRQALGICWCIGLAKDLLSSGPPGGYALLYLIAATAIVRIRSEAETRSVVTYAPYAFVASLATETVYLLAVSVRSGTWLIGGSLRVLLTSSLATAILMLPCAWALSRFVGRTGLRRRYHLGST